jgi:hypothetical protein
MDQAFQIPQFLLLTNGASHVSHCFFVSPTALMRLA